MKIMRATIIALSLLTVLSATADAAWDGYRRQGYGWGSSAWRGDYYGYGSRYNKFYYPNGRTRNPANRLDW